MLHKMNCYFDLNTSMEFTGQRSGTKIRGITRVSSSYSARHCLHFSLLVFRYFSIEQKWREKEHAGWFGIGSFMLGSYVLCFLKV